jgi:Fic family protein
MKYIHQHKNWPEFHWDVQKINECLHPVKYKQGRLCGKMEALGFLLRSEAMLESLTIDILKSSEIEGEILNPEQVRSSIARRLGLDIGGLVNSERHVDGVVDMILDATQNFTEKLTADRLFGWHSALFPSGRSGMFKILVGKWRNGSKGPMQVVSGPVGKEKIHYEAPAADKLSASMKSFLNWFNKKDNIEPVLKSAIAHFWFVTIHPFEDGNGRMARAIADMQLARADHSAQRFYSMSAQIQKERNHYYDILEKSQKGNLDITEWLEWFLKCLDRSLDATEITLAKVFNKANFWQKHSATLFNARQTKIINKMLDKFDGKLTSSKWAKINNCSHDTAIRDIHDLIAKKILIKEASGGRSTSYILSAENLHQP